MDLQDLSLLLVHHYRLLIIHLLVFSSHLFRCLHLAFNFILHCGFYKSVAFWCGRSSPFSLLTSISFPVPPPSLSLSQLPSLSSYFLLIFKISRNCVSYSRIRYKGMGLRLPGAVLIFRLLDGGACHRQPLAKTLVKKNWLTWDEAGAQKKALQKPQNSLNRSCLAMAIYTHLQTSMLLSNCLFVVCANTTAPYSSIEYTYHLTILVFNLLFISLNIKIPVIFHNYFTIPVLSI